MGTSSLKGSNISRLNMWWGRVVGTIKQMFTMNTLIKNEYVEGKVGTKSQVSELLDVQECLSRKLNK